MIRNRNDKVGEESKVRSQKSSSSPVHSPQNLIFCLSTRGVMELVTTDQSGLMQDQIDNGQYFNEQSGELNLSTLADEAVEPSLASFEAIEAKVKSITLHRTHLAPRPLIAVLSTVLVDRKYRNLRSLNVSYCDLPEIALNYLCEYVNPFSGGFNVTYLNVARCNLGIHETIKLLTALFANITLEELILTGNHCGDKAVPALLTMLTKYENNIHTLGLGANKFTSEGIKQLCSVLESPKQPLARLYLGGNTALGDEVTEELFVALNKGSTVTTLSLSDTSLADCEWARFLPFMSRLSTLDLSYNLITDDELGKLSKALERTYCVNHLDLSFNRFGGIKCNVLEHLVAQNGALLSLSLRGNRCEDSVWTAIHRGLLVNNTLLTLNLSECNISLQCALEICKAFRRNDIVSVDFSNNPLPEALIVGPRAYAMEHLHKAAVKKVIARRQRAATPDTSTNPNNAATNATNPPTSTSATIPEPVLPLHPAAHALSAARCRAWTTAVSQEVTMSLNTLNIVANRTAAMEAKEKAARAAIENPQLRNTGSPGALHLSTGLDSPSAGSTLPPFSPSRSATAHPGDQGAQGLSLTSPVLIAQSEHYLSPSRLRDIVAASDLANTADKKLMHVAYGRAPLVIGSIAVTSLTTYGECMKLVLPLVAEYVSTIAANESIHNELVSKYSLMDAKGEALTQEHLQLRRVWPEFCEQPEPVLVVRPGNWVKL